jgi:hypothetical protein
MISTRCKHSQAQPCNISPTLHYAVCADACVRALPDRCTFTPPGCSRRHSAAGAGASRTSQRRSSRPRSRSAGLAAVFHLHPLSVASQRDSPHSTLRPPRLPAAGRPGGPGAERAPQVHLTRCNTKMGGGPYGVIYEVRPEPAGIRGARPGTAFQTRASHLRQPGGVPLLARTRASRPPPAAPLSALLSPARPPACWRPTAGDGRTRGSPGPESCRCVARPCARTRLVTHSAARARHVTGGPAGCVDAGLLSARASLAALARPPRPRLRPRVRARAARHPAGRARAPRMGQQVASTQPPRGPNIIIFIFKKPFLIRPYNSSLLRDGPAERPTRS